MENNLQPLKRNLPRDVFLHLFTMVTLYWGAVSFITLCWQYINYAFPDVLNVNYGFSSSMRFALASLFIVFPLYILGNWILQKIYTGEPVVRESKIRKWLIYLTLFITALVIIGDLVFTLNTFLNGEITARFILKALSIIVVLGIIFWYYLDDVRRATVSTKAKLFAWIASAVVLLFVIGAFFIVGSPMSARLVQFDAQRTSDLQAIQYQIVNYWQKKGTLPVQLTDINDSISGYSVPVDPQTNAPYEYRVTDAKNVTFELCATFNTNNNQVGPKTAPAPDYPYGISQNWNHSSGRVCFDRTIDSQLYPSSNTPK